MHHIEHRPGLRWAVNSPLYLGENLSTAEAKVDYNGTSVP